ncbi:LPXTG cell wall anchor domain-containing protein [Liquorilactobacillus satsumensis]|uniref:LPXTG cell wall anchor domain-containing protein n=1 Tax=Liquorilactobacillus satsumensis TaxID=259059 RepID=UPI0029057189|nr:LPXTG cell wall anchor domain-containing protein [Liquorilactobacillus satsumensis]
MNTSNSTSGSTSEVAALNRSSKTGELPQTGEFESNTDEYLGGVALLTAILLGLKTRKKKNQQQ